MAKKIIKLGTYRTLVTQFDKLARHNRRGSFRTKARYYEAYKRFCAFLADEFHPLTFHGLRHTYAAEKYRKLIDSGMSSLDAHFEVSRLLGHERVDVTDIYLASLPKEGRHGK